MGGELTDCARRLRIDALAVTRLGAYRWRLIREVLSFRGNFISGLQIYEHAWSIPAQGKHWTEPCATDSAIEWMIENAALRPSKFRPYNATRVAALNLTYNADYIRRILPRRPFAGTFVDWDYEVVCDVTNPYGQSALCDHWQTGETRCVRVGELCIVRVADGVKSVTCLCGWCGICLCAEYQNVLGERWELA